MAKKKKKQVKQSRPKTTSNFFEELIEELKIQTSLLRKMKEIMRKKT